MQKDLSFLYTFSFISQILLMVVSKNSKIYNSLYLANILSLIGFCIMLYLYPLFFYNKYNWIIKTNIFTFNFICFLMHIIPLILFKHKQNINKKNIILTITYTIILLIIYLILFKKYLQNNLYPLNILELIILVSFILFFTSIYYSIF